MAQSRGEGMVWRSEFGRAGSCAADCGCDRADVGSERPLSVRYFHCAVAALCLTVSAAVAAQKIEFVPVKPSVLEERLRRVRTKIQEREQTLRALFESAGCAD